MRDLICNARDKIVCEFLKDLLAASLEFFGPVLGSDRMVLIIMFDMGMAYVTERDAVVFRIRALLAFGVDMVQHLTL